MRLYFASDPGLTIGALIALTLTGEAWAATVNICVRIVTLSVAQAKADCKPCSVRCWKARVLQESCFAMMIVTAPKLLRTGPTAQN